MADFAQGARFLELREAQRISREDAAHEIGVTSRTLYTWEKKDGPIKWEHAHAAGCR